MNNRLLLARSEVYSNDMLFELMLKQEHVLDEYKLKANWKFLFVLKRDVD